MSEKPSVLIVEDEVLIAMDLQAQLEDSGWSVIGPVGQSAHALTLLDSAQPHFAVLDINLGHDTSFAVADRLAEAGVPFLFLSGASNDILPDRFHTRTLLQKPIRFEQLAAAMQGVAV
jgi:DNA-binding response OmpR family regulator